MDVDTNPQGFPTPNQLHSSIPTYRAASSVSPLWEEVQAALEALHDTCKFASMEAAEEAAHTMTMMTMEINLVLKSYSKYYIQDDLFLVAESCIWVKSKPLHCMVNILSRVLSVGLEDKQTDLEELWSSARPGTWFHLA